MTNGSHVAYVLFHWIMGPLPHRAKQPIRRKMCQNFPFQWHHSGTLFKSFLLSKQKPPKTLTLPETNIFAPINEKSWNTIFLLGFGRPIFRCQAVSFKEDINHSTTILGLGEISTQSKASFGLQWPHLFGWLARSWVFGGDGNWNFSLFSSPGKMVNRKIPRPSPPFGWC